MKGRTTRLILQALIHLSEGCDITVVAMNEEIAVGIARQVCAWAKRAGIPCRNARGNDPDAPVVKARPMNVPPPLPTPKSKVLIDHSAQHERTCVRASAVRTVITDVG